MAFSRTAKAGILASGHVLTSLATLAVFAVLARVFDEADYSTYRKALLAYQFVAPMLMLGLPSALYYFLPRSPDRLRATLMENLVLLGVMGGVFALFLVCGGNILLAAYFDNPRLEKALLVLAPYPVLLLPASALAACLMCQDRVKQVAIYQIGSRLLFFVGVISFILFVKSPEAALWGTVVGAGVALVPALWLMLKACPGVAKVSLRGMIEQLRYSVPLGLGTTISLVNRQVAIFIVAGAVSEEAFAVFINGAMEVPLVGIITGSAASVLLPDLTKRFSEGKESSCIDLWKRSAIKAGVLLLPAAAFLLAVAPDLMAVIYSEKYRGSSTVFRVFLLLLPIRIVFFGVIFQASGNSKTIMVRAVVALIINVALALVLVNLMGYFGAVLASILTIYCYTVPFNLRKISQITGCKVGDLLPYRELGKILIIALAASIPLWGIALVPLLPVFRLAISAIVFAVAIMFLMKIFKIDAFEREVQSVLRKFGRRNVSTGGGN